MFLPERMISASVICPRKNLDSTLEALSRFGEFHVEEAVEDLAEEGFDENLKKTEEAAVSVNEVIKGLQIEKADFADIFRTEKTQKTKVKTESWLTLTDLVHREAAQLRTEIEKVTSNLQTLEAKAADLAYTHKVLLTLRKMDADLDVIDGLKQIQVTFASIPTKNLADFNMALKSYPTLTHLCCMAKNVTFVSLIIPAKYADDAKKTLNTHHAEIFNIPEGLPRNISTALKETEQNRKNNTKDLLAAKKSLERFAQTNGGHLLSLRETAQNILILLQAKKKMLQSVRLATIKGFVPKGEFQKFSLEVEKALEGKVLIIENKVAETEDPPTKFHNLRLVKPFEELVKLYGFPHYDELDPTPFIAISFPIIFGLMFGDAGHGLVLLIGGLALGFLIKKQGTLKNICWILAACGAAAIAAGLLFGEMFGVKVFAPLWFSPFDNVLTFLTFSIFVGVAQITVGLVLDATNSALKRDYSGVFLVSAPKIAFYVGSIILIAVYQLNFSAWLGGPILLAVIPFLILIFGESVARAAGLVGKRKPKLSLAERLFESGDFALRLLSNTVSYARILALLMAHWALVMVAYVVAGLVGSGSLLNLIVGGIIIVVGNIFVLALEGLIVFIHTVRLHFYEWFSKFYQGTGTPFTPYKQVFERTELKFEKKTNT